MLRRTGGSGLIFPPMAAETQLTPMMTQYRRIKGELPKDALLLFRLGDFYEMFFEDAQTGAQILNLALTARNGVPMCGLPHHAANAYLGRLLRAGRKVAICDQLEEARPGKLVKREVTQILSPGTHFDERMLVADRNNFLAAICPAGKVFGLALVDLTTGEFLTTELENESALLAELERLRPAEVIYPGEHNSIRELLGGQKASRIEPLNLSQAASLPSHPLRPPTVPSPLPSDGRGEGQGEVRVRVHGEGRGEGRVTSNFGWIANGYDDWTFAPETAQFTVRDHFQVASLDGFGLKDRGGHRRGGRGVALSHPTVAPGRAASHAAFVLPSQ